MKRGIVLCAAGAALLLLALSRTWLTLRTPGAGLLPDRLLPLAGDRLVPGARELALLGLTGVAALPATRAWGRLLVGVLLAGAGAVAVALLARFLAAPSLPSDVPGPAGAALHPGGWPYVGLLGALLLTAAGALTAVRGRAWGGLGSRYDAPAEPKAESPWDVLDRGDDPTT